MSLFNSEVLIRLKMTSINMAQIKMKKIAILLFLAEVFF